MPKRLVIAAEVDPHLVERARNDARFDVTFAPVRSEEELLRVVGDAEILVTRAYNQVTGRVIEAAPSLALIAQGTSGIDNIDSDAARERGVSIVHLPGANANAVAELVIGYLLSMTRTIPFYTRQVVAGVWERGDCATRHELAHYPLGIIGLGQVGRIVARLAGAFGMKVRAFDPYLGDRDFQERGAMRAASLDELIEGSGILTMHVPLTSETRRMIDASRIAQLRRGAYLVNASRGEVLDQRAALASLAEGHLAGLALDVFDPEPPHENFPDDPRLVLTPHTAGCTYECRSAIGDLLFDRIVEWMG
jgi:phosphoglycerate dehydrogenase-like enzyme